jgi:hypothetical protein
MGGKNGGGGRGGSGGGKGRERATANSLGDERTTSAGITFRAKRGVGIEIGGKRVNLSDMEGNRFNEVLTDTINAGLNGKGKGAFNTEIKRIESGKGPSVRDAQYNKYRDKLYELKEIFPNAKPSARRSS